MSHNGRLGGILGVSRSLGDIEYQPFLSAVPTIEKYEIQPHDCCICMGCDGVWDVVSPQDARRVLSKSRVPEITASDIRAQALCQGSSDNISTIVISLYDDVTT